MIEQTITPKAAELAGLLKNALSDNLDEEAFIASYLAGLVKILEADPRQYRSYGPYWWPLKAMLAERGIVVAGDLELGTLQHYTLETPALTLCAAWAYQQERIAEGKLRTASHQLDMVEGELYEYELVDDEMERRIAYGDPLPTPTRH